MNSYAVTHPTAQLPATDEESEDAEVEGHMRRK